jgi:hypothetical protein
MEEDVFCGTLHGAWGLMTVSGPTSWTVRLVLYVIPGVWVVAGNKLWSPASYRCTSCSTG